MRFAPRFEVSRRWGKVVIAVGVSAIWTGCASEPAMHRVVEPVSAELSPPADPVAPHDAWRLAEAYAIQYPGCDVMVGSGDSMLPLYPDRTVLVVQPVATSELRRGMTVVFIGDQGQPVAHVLIARTPRGWRAIGLGNSDPDLTRVGYGNLIGLVVKAYAPTVRAAGLAAEVHQPILGETAAGLGAIGLPGFVMLDASPAAPSGLRAQ